MNDFPTLESDNIGGIKAFNFALMSDTVNIINHDVTFAAGKDWLTGYSTITDSEFSITPKNTDAGTHFEYNFTGFFPGNNNDAIALFSEMKKQKFVVNFVDNDSLNYLLPNARFDFSFTTSKVNGTKGWQFTFSLKSTSILATWLS